MTSWKKLANLKKRWPKQTLEQRFWSHVDKSGPCWLWTAYCHPTGYGVFNIRKGKWEYAHRMAYIFIYGAIPFEKHVLHHCDNPPCVKPDHLWPGTQKQNMKDMRDKGRHRSAKPMDQDLGRLNV